MAQACQIPEAQRDLQKAAGPQSYSHASMTPVTNLAPTASRGSKHGRDIDDSSQEVSLFFPSFASFICIQKKQPALMLYVSHITTGSCDVS